MLYEVITVGDTAAATEGLVEYEVLCRRHYMRRMNSLKPEYADKLCSVLDLPAEVSIALQAFPHRNNFV